MEWKTIDSAPKDGTKVLLYGLPIFSMVAVGSYIKYLVNEIEGWYIPEMSLSVLPTHWMPLPSPPLDIEE